MKILANLSLRTKSILLMTLTGFIALIFAVTAFIGYELFMFRTVAENESLAIARIVSLNSMASLSFRDADAARETLASLGGESSINAAALYDQDGKLFVRTGDPAAPGGELPDSLAPELRIGSGHVLGWDGSILRIHYPVLLEKTRLGTVALITVQTALVQRLRTYLGLSALIFLISSILAYIVSLYSQRIITAPVLALQETMQHVASSKNYSIRADVLTDDELGQLAGRFNDMLDQIREQDNELRYHRELLEENVRARTAELSKANTSLQQTVEELQIAKDRAEAANQAKMQFLANISHEIRTPMNGVLGIAEILERSMLTERQRQMLRTLQQSGEDLMVIINDLLDFSKLEAGKFDLNISTFNLYNLLDTSTDVFNAPARKKGVELACIVQPDVPAFIQSDPDRIRQIIINLIGNAIKFTSRGSVVIEIGTGQDTGTQGQLIITVTDTGIGIPEKALEKIFSPFTQADETMTRSHGGTGLGLAIVHQLLHLMDGSIDVTSREGEGSVFTVTIPFIHPESRLQPDTAPFACIHVAAIGLSPLVRASLNNILKRYEIEARHHESPQEALAETDGRTLFFVEASADAKKTEECLSLLRAHPAEKSVVLITPDLDESELRAELLTDKVIGKPLRQSDIQNIVLEAAGLSMLSQYDETNEYQKDVVFDARALLVEDNKVNQKVAQGALRIFGLDIDIAENGLVAVEMLRQSDYDIVFMDCQMPLMDGYTASTRIREMEAGRSPANRVPIVAMTAHALAKDKLRCFQSGMDGYLAKPFTLKNLSRVLKQWLPDRMRTVQGAAEEPEATQKTSDVLDESILQNLRNLQSNGSPDLLRTVFTAYATSANQLMREIGEAVRSRDFVNLGKHCHTLKSSSFNVGAKQMSALAKEMENLAREEQDALLDTLHEDLGREHLRVLEAIARQAGEQ
jgi:signal transduction histidine kinase